MDILDRLLQHDAWTTRQILERCRGLSDAQLDQPFDVGVGSVRATLIHIIGNMETWTGLISLRPAEQVRRPGAYPHSVEGLFERMEEVAAELSTAATRLRAEGRLDDLFPDVLDDPPTLKSFGGAIAHVITHSHIHRGELLHMLARLGLQDLPEGDVLSWEQQHRFGGRWPDAR
jgi:uncharacterized damage-inducible protein DinB